MKNRNRVTLIIVFIIMNLGFNSLPIYALDIQDDIKIIVANQLHGYNVKTIISYEEAVQMALDNSYNLKDKQLQLEKVEDSYENTNLIPGTYNPSLIKSRESLSISKEWLQKQIEIEKDKISNEVLKSIENLNIALSELEVMDLRIEIIKERLNAVKLKLEYGLVSDYSKDVIEKTYEEILNQRDLLKITYNNENLELTNLLGLDLYGNYLIGEEIIHNKAYKPIEDMDIDNLINKELNTNPNIWYAQKQVDSAELDIKLYEYNNGSSYSAEKIDVSTAKNNLKKQKKDLNNELRSRYNEIKKLENNYEILKNNLEKKKRDLELVRKKYELGTVILLDVREAELTVEELELNILKNSIYHNNMVELLYNPYLS